MLLLVATLALAGSVNSLRAADFSFSTGFETGREYINISGMITEGDAALLDAHIKDNPQVGWVSMSSLGGLASEGYKLGTVISEHSLNTYVPYGAACLSACYIAFIGGVEYDIDGLLGAHNAWLAEPIDGYEHNDYIRSGQQWGTYDAAWHILNGFEIGLPYAISNNTNEETFLGWTDEEDFLKSFARTEANKIYEYLDNGLYTREWVEDHTVTSANLEQLAMHNFNRRWPDWFDPR